MILYEYETLRGYLYEFFRRNMQLYKYAVCIIAFSMCAFFCIGSFAESERENPRPGILYISSYSPTHEFSQKQIDGIKSVFGDKVLLESEYLYFDVADKEENYRILYEMIELHSSADVPVYDGIIVGGDEALNAVCHMTTAYSVILP